MAHESSINKGHKRSERNWVLAKQHRWLHEASRGLGGCKGPTFVGHSLSERDRPCVQEDAGGRVTERLLSL